MTLTIRNKTKGEAVELLAPTRKRPRLAHLKSQALTFPNVSLNAFADC